jgi:hypothetical protein
LPPFVKGQRRNYKQDDKDEQDCETIQQAVDDDRGERGALINLLTVPKDDRSNDLTEPHWKDHISH